MLPSKTAQFAQAEYWNEFFIERKKTSTKAFEWYGEFSKDLLKLIEDDDRTKGKNFESLVLGCGNSTLSSDLIKHSCAGKVVSVDFSEKAIEEMQQKYKSDSRLVWVLADVTMMPEDYTNRYDTVWDKGALDALLGEVDDDAKSLDLGKKMLLETLRCLKPGGRYYCVTLLQDHVLGTLLDCFFDTNGFESINLIPFNAVADSILCPFLVVMKKKHDSEESSKVLVQGSPLQGSRKEFESMVHQTQIAYSARRDLKKPKQGLRGIFSIASKTDPTRERFRLQVIDTTKKKIPFGALILPQGREHEWSFSNEEGQMQVATSNEIGRLIFISLGRNEKFENGMEGIQQELSSSILEFAPPNLPSGFKIPYLAVAQDIGQRTILREGDSEISGPFTVEDVNIDGSVFRRLIFLRNPLAIQSECQLLANSKPDITNLSFDFHTAMYSMLLAKLIPSQKTDQRTKKLNCLICGVGGGGLMSYMIEKQSEVMNVEGVEIDPILVQIARDSFGLPSAAVVHVADALEYLQTKRTGSDVDILLVDINGGAEEDADKQTSLRFPPEQFLDLSFLEHVKNQTLRKDTGVFVLNFGCRSPEQTKAYLQLIARVFGNVIVLDLSEVSGDLNMILYCCPGMVMDIKTLDAFVKSCDIDGLNEGLRTLNADGLLEPLGLIENNAATKKKPSKKKKKKKN